MSSLHSNLKQYLDSILSSSSYPSLPCNYYTNNEFLDCYDSSVGGQNSASFFHLNIRSLNANHLKLYQLLSNLKFRFEIIALTEIWSFNITFYMNLFPDYHFYYSLPNNTSVGGVGMFIHNSYSV